MIPVSGFEARLLVALALLGSALLHGSALLLVPSLEGAHSPRDAVEIDLVSHAGDAPPEAEPTESARSHDDVSGADPALDDGHVVESEVPLASASTDLHWRTRLALREAALRRDLEVNAQRIVALERASAQRMQDGDPEAVYACGAERVGTRLDVDAERDVSGYAGVLPSGLFPSRYLAGMREISTSSARVLGTWRFALPAEVLPIALDVPKGALLAVGRKDARCLVGVEITPTGVFPLRFRHVPVRVVDDEDGVSWALVDVRLYRDATFALDVIEGGPLPFSRGALYDHEAVGRNLRQHYLGARALRGLAGLLLSE